MTISVNDLAIATLDLLVPPFFEEENMNHYPHITINTPESLVNIYLYPNHTYLIFDETGNIMEMDDLRYEQVVEFIRGSLQNINAIILQNWLDERSRNNRGAVIYRCDSNWCPIMPRFWTEPADSYYRQMNDEEIAEERAERLAAHQARQF